jgi:hypothetical protein
MPRERVAETHKPRLNLPAGCKAIRQKRGDCPLANVTDKQDKASAVMVRKMNFLKEDQDYA